MNNFEDSLLETLMGSDLSNSLIEFSENNLDLITENETIKTIPILNTIVGAGKTLIQVRERIFLKKVLFFLKQLDKTSAYERDLFIKQHFKTQKDKNKLCNSLIEILDRLDDSAKSELIGKIFLKFLKGEIDEGTMYRSFKVVDRTYLSDLITLEYFERYQSMGKEIPWLVLSELLSQGLLTYNSPGTIGDIGEHFRMDPRNISITPTGKMYADLELQMVK